MCRIRHALNYQIFWIIRWHLYWPNFLQVIFCYFSYPWAVQLIREVFYLDISLICWFSIIRLLVCVFWSLHSRRSCGIRRQGIRRYHNGWCTHTLVGLFQHISEICLLQPWNFLLVKNKIYCLGTTFLRCWIIRISELEDIRLTDFGYKYIMASYSLVCTVLKIQNGTSKLCLEQQVLYAVKYSFLLFSKVVALCKLHLASVIRSGRHYHLTISHPACFKIWSMKSQIMAPLV